ncbi:hypothetical protein BC831DRAFT_550298 [Entophlyctis helioformis]|nr:hypothetical protein BC831DRAFT_550298 [Entophlyctis helioformis]
MLASSTSLDCEATTITQLQQQIDMLKQQYHRPATRLLDSSQGEAQHVTESIAKRSAESTPGQRPAMHMMHTVENKHLDGSGTQETAVTEAAKLSSLEVLLRSRPCVPSNNHFAVLKICNISWDLTASDVVSFFAGSEIPTRHLPPYYHHSVHIIMDRATGKTRSECFVEFPSATQAQAAHKSHKRGILKGRLVSVEFSSQEELCAALFPSLAASVRRAQQEQPKRDAENQAADNDNLRGLGGMAGKFPAYLIRLLR